MRPSEATGAAADASVTGPYGGVHVDGLDDFEASHSRQTKDHAAMGAFCVIAFGKRLRRDMSDFDALASRPMASFRTLPACATPTATTHGLLKTMAVALRRPASTLIAPSDSRDPFYVTPGRMAPAQWFAWIWAMLNPPDSPTSQQGPRRPLGEGRE